MGLLGWLTLIRWQKCLARTCCLGCGVAGNANGLQGGLLGIYRHLGFDRMSVRFRPVRASVLSLKVVCIGDCNPVNQQPGNSSVTAFRGPLLGRPAVGPALLS